MIPRYTREKMARVWTDTRRFETWLQIELLALEAWNTLGVVPDEALAAIRSKAAFDVERIDEIERTVKHDVIAFLSSVAEHVGEPARYIHLGLTSSDILDTSLAVLLKEAGGILLGDIDELLDALREQAFRHKTTLTIGRTHGVHAEPTTFGLKMAGHWDEIRRGRERFAGAVREISVGKISGAVGNFFHLDPRVEEHVCRGLGLAPAPVSSQIIQRDAHAAYLTALALLASSLERLALEIRLLARTEVTEAQEAFSKGQKGSSAMPHKKNPVTAEQICGLARLVRGNAHASMENIALWHERDISHSSVERIILPDTTILMDYLLAKAAGMVRALVVFPENMRRNLDLTGGSVFSESVLLKLILSGLSREAAYALVQRTAHGALEKGTHLREALLADTEIVGRLGEETIRDIFRPEKAAAHVDHIFERVFGKETA
jgi:adenylosuccinate lyase